MVQLGDDVKISLDVQFVTHDGGMHVFRNLDLSPKADKFGRIIVGNNVFIGMRTIIMPNVKIGDNVVIGAGSVVTRDIPSNSVACGVPAKVISTIEEYYEKNKGVIDETYGLSANKKREYLKKKYKIID